MHGAEALLTIADLHSEAHFLRAVTQLASSQEITVHRPIYAESGAKLIDEGVRLDSSMLELLGQNRLAAALDDHLTLQHPLDVVALQARVHLLCGSSALGQLLQRFMGEKQYLLVEVLRYMKWPTRASFKLTLMQQHLPDLFEHSVLVMMVAVCLASEEKMSIHDCAELAAAALLHDIGMLYMPSNWTDSAYKLSAAERKQLAVHTVVAMLEVRSTQAYSGRAEDAVLQHHERCDGSGYPGGLRTEAITPWGHILMLAEVVSAFFQKYNDIPAQRLSLMLRMNHNRFQPQLMKHVFRMLSLETQTNEVVCNTNTMEVRAVIATLSGVFQYWSKCKRSFVGKWQTLPGGRAGVYIDARLAFIEKSLAESGSHPRQQADWLQMFEEDPSSMQEVVMINKEALWQVEACVENCMRRWPQLLQPQSPLESALCDWLLSCRQVLSSGGASAPSASSASVSTNADAPPKAD